MPLVPDWNFCGPTYRAFSPIFDCERCINFYPEFGPASAKSKCVLVGTPGIVLFTTLPLSPVRCLWAGNGRMFAVGGTHVYEVNPVTGALITDYGAIPGSTGLGPCQLVAGGVYPATQLLLMDSSVPAVFNVNPVGPTITNVFSGYSLEYLDTFFFALSATVGNRVNASASGDGTTWPGLSFADRTGVIDQTTGLAVVNSNMAVMGQKNSEFWYDAGNATFPLARINGSTMNIGTLGLTGNHHNFTISKIANSIMWLGLDERGGAVVYLLNGFQAVRVSNHAIEAMLNQAGFLSTARAFSYQEDGHLFYVLNLPNGNGGLGATFVYDLTTQMWHERYYLNPGSGQLERARADCFCSVPVSFGFTNFVGDYSNGNIYEMAITTAADNGNPIYRERTTPHVNNQSEWIRYNSLMLDFDPPGGGTLAWQGYLSNDGGATFSAAKPFQKISSGAATAMGPALGFDTYALYQLGRARDRVFKVTVTDSANPIRIVNAYLNVG